MEFLDILDENGVNTGKTASRADVHKYGYWHKVVHVWIINSKNELLLQLRSMEKENHPGEWDISVGGHIPAGEDDVSSAIRETEEEIGLKITPTDLKFIGSVSQESSKGKKDYINKEVDSVFVVKKDLDISKLKMQKGEVDELRFIPLVKFKEMIVRSDKSLVMHPAEFELLFNYLVL